MAILVVLVLVLPWELTKHLTFKVLSFLHEVIYMAELSKCVFTFLCFYR